MATIAPVSNPGGNWATWNYNDIYTGPSGTGKFVPKVNDLVVKIQGAVLTWYMVSAVSAGSMIATLVLCIDPAATGALTSTDVMFGISPTQPDTYRV